MSATGTYIVSNPTPGQEYVAPSAFWVVPNGGSSVTCTVQTFDGNGNLTSVSSLTAICRNVSAGSDAGSYTWNGGNTANSTTSNGTNGGNVFAPAGKVGSGCAQLRMYLSYTGSIYDQGPNTPSLVGPSGTITTTNPSYVANYSHPQGTPFGSAEFQVFNGSNGSGALLYDSGTFSVSGGEQASNQMIRQASALSFGASYSWRARVADTNGIWSGWSGWLNFSVAQGPNFPANVGPSGLVASLTPTWQFTYSSPASVGMTAYRLVVEAEPQDVWIYDSGWVSLSLASGATTSGTIPSAAGLQYGGQYAINFMVQDANGAQAGWTKVFFTVAGLPQVAPSSPSNNATVNSQTPTFAWSYNDVNYTQAKYQVQVINKTTGASIWDSGQVASAASTVTLPGANSIAWNTPIQWRVQVWDTAGLSSGWSAYAAALVNNTPTVALTSPSNNGTVTTNTPTVTWTYTASAGGFAQASAQIVLSDTNGNVLATYTLSGSGTSYTLPAGVLTNTLTYTVQVLATDTNGDVGQSAVTTFTVSYVPPADMQGQPLASAKNALLAPYLNQDGGSGVATNWTSGVSGGAAASFSVDPNVTQPVQLASGDGAVTGAQKITLSSSNAANLRAIISQSISLATAGWTAGTTKLSAFCSALLTKATGNPKVWLQIDFYANTTLLSTASGVAQTDTAGQFVRLLGPQGVTIPATTTSVTVYAGVFSQASGDTGTAWLYGIQLEAAVASDAAFIAGDMGTGYSFDANTGASVRTFLLGAAPTVQATPGADTDPVNAQGGSITLGWDTTLADARFYAYLIERRRQDEATDDTKWQTLATLTSKSVSGYTDYTAGNNVTYQYAVRQQITYSDGSVGLSQHRAIVVGSVTFTPAWYLVNVEGPLYNVRLPRVATDRTWDYKEQATYTPYLGREGMARDAGAPTGYAGTLVAYFNTAWGADRATLRRLFTSMMRLGVVWYLKGGAGVVVPVYLQSAADKETDDYGDTLISVTLTVQQAQATEDY